ncbi:HAAS signaling domain-containing protein [Krasilnikovia sp. MM14-A1259]|uniref:HAAS signaling domain-containing protein n=1 Tax=Krasilnikovia sp. MM14-A1259 TaxID=3373539 RepID=UPI00380FFF27
MNSTAQDEITAYVFAVRAALGDLPESLRDELLEDLPEHLAEVLAEGDGTLVDRLGLPSAYAAELRSSAGFVGGFPDPPPSPNRYGELRQEVLRGLRVADERLGPLVGAARASEFLMLLRPAWWVLRGYLVAMVVAALLDDSGQPIGLLPRIGGSEAVALVLLAAGILGSIWLGRRTVRLARWPRYALYAGSVVLVLVAFGGFMLADSSTRGSEYADVGYSDPYGNVQDVFVYDQEGRLVKGARLFDQDGTPIHLGNAWCADEANGGGTDAANDSVYPYCPQNAPFVMPSTGSSAPAAPAPRASSSAPVAQPSPAK